MEPMIGYLVTNSDYLWGEYSFLINNELENIEHRLFDCGEQFWFVKDIDDLATYFKITPNIVVLRVQSDSVYKINQQKCYCNNITVLNQVGLVACVMGADKSALKWARVFNVPKMIRHLITDNYRAYWYALLFGERDYMVQFINKPMTAIDWINSFGSHRKELMPLIPENLQYLLRPGTELPSEDILEVERLLQS